MVSWYDFYYTKIYHHTTISNTADMETVKQCISCRQIKAAKLFYQDERSKDGKMAICKDCDKERIAQMTKAGYYNSKNADLIREEHPDFVNQVRKDMLENKFIQPRKKK
ncbi:MAG: hypothetical protein JWN76_42 [Chitinophagaceae bacterium]|nr:hypothetical protein [Chitinophagaceae bacterium]